MLARLDDALAREQRFASTAAHELRTPLAQMRTALEVALRKPREAGEYRDALQETVTDVQRLQKLVIGLLELARSPVDATKSARSILLESLLTSAQKNLPTLQLNGQAAGVHVYADHDLTSAAIANVLENATRYAPSSPPEISIISSTDTIHLTISDRGPGIPPADHERIFEPLTRLNTTSAHHEDGVGLGLSIARATLRAFGGDLIATSRPDAQSGARFVFTFRKAPPVRED
jgi:two-component system heavy metal sensor histidine kinase CusS